MGLAIFLAFAVTGMIGGAALGLALRNWRKTIALALAGALGFGIGIMILMFIPLHFVLDVFYTLTEAEILLGVNKFTLMVTIIGIPGGASIGAVLGYLEKDE